MNMATKLTSSDIVREINLMQHFDWTIDQKEERILVMEKALTIVKAVLTDIGLDDFNSRIYFSGQQGTVEHYLLICKNLVIEDDEPKLNGENFLPFVCEKTQKSAPYSLGNIESELIPEDIKTPNSLYIAYGLFAVWFLFILYSIL